VVEFNIVLPQPLLRLPEHCLLESLAAQTPPPPQAFQHLGVRFLQAPRLHPLLKFPPSRLGIPPDAGLHQQSLSTSSIGTGLNPLLIQGTRSYKEMENHRVVRILFETAKRQDKKAYRSFLDLFTKNTADTQAALYRHPAGRKPPAPQRC
jgi:hypothetical protein